MELGIPLLALGGLYVVANQSKKKVSQPTVETFKTEQNGWGVRNNSNITNVDVPDKNYPDYSAVVVSSETEITSKLSTVNKYDGNTAYTDKYFNPEQNTKLVESYAPLNSEQNYGGIASSSTFVSLTGDKVTQDYFRHNNMVPFFGGHIRSRNVDANSGESILDNYVGTGSQTISKREQAPLFAPGENYHWASGMPNTTDFQRSRVNPSLRMANVKPFEEERVAPGIGLGYTSQGSGGFNSGLMSRDLWGEKNVDELRVATNPKSGGNVIYGYEGPAIHAVTTRGDQGIQEKNRVSTTFEMGPERYLTTTGASKGHTVRAEQIDRFVSRPETTQEYGGVAKSTAGTNHYFEGEYMPSTRIQLGDVPNGPAFARGKNDASTYDYGKNSVAAYPNNRTTTTKQDYFGAIGGAFGAAVAPLLNALRPSRKENTIGSLRPYSNPSRGGAASYMFDPNDKPGLTLRDATRREGIYTHINSNQNGGAYAVTEQQPIHNARDTTSVYYAGGSSAGERGRVARSYEAEYNQRNNDIKSSTIDGRMTPGNMSLFTGEINMRNKERDSFLKNQYAVIPNGPKNTANLATFGQVQKSPKELNSGIQMDRTTPDIMSALSGNPYVIPYRAK
jgi:hypothetical protein